MKKLIVAFLILSFPALSFAGDEITFYEGKTASLSTESSRALAVFVRPQKTITMTVTKLWVFADQEFLGVTQGESHFAAAISPGKHRLWIANPGHNEVDGFEMNFAAGQVYFFGIDGSIRIGLKPVPVLFPLPASAGQQLLAENKRLAEATSEGKMKAQKYISKYYQNKIMDQWAKISKRHQKMAEKRLGDPSDF